MQNANDYLASGHPLLQRSKLHKEEKPRAPEHVDRWDRPLEEFRVHEREYDHLLEGFDVVVEPTDVFERHRLVDGHWLNRLL